MWKYALVVVVAVVCIAGGFAAGYVLHPSSSTPSPSTPNSTLSILGAGTLQPIFPGIASALANSTPGISAPSSAQLYEGSLAAVSAIGTLHDPYDVLAVADYRLIPHSLESTYAPWELVFGSTPEVLTYDPTISLFSNINATNWPAKLESSGMVLGIANQSTDPNGYNGIFVLELEGLLENNSLSAVYSHFYTTPVGALAEPNSATTKVEPESQAATLLGAHTVSAFITYRSYAVTNHLSYVTLDPRVGLGELDPADVAYYSNASTTILSGTSTEVVKGGPVLFAATIPSTAPNAVLGAQFLQYLISPAGDAQLSADGFTTVFPAYSDQPVAKLPPSLVPIATPMPSALATLLG